MATENPQLRLREQGVKDDALYERFAKHIEGDLRGEFVAISREGKIIVSRKEFGEGKFAFRRIGSKALGRWRLCA